VAALAVAVPALVAVQAASAHVVRTVGPYTVEIGWGTEPPLAGFENSVEVTVADADGRPVADLGGSAGVAVSFGEARTKVPLVATEEPGEFRATLIPTRPGTYSFQVEATIDGRPVSTGATCSEGTFDCVIPATGAQFPVQDPSVGEVAERIDSSLPRAEQAADDADSAKSIAIAAIVLAALALAGAVGVAVHGRRKSG
jgi:hypothetical protein